MNPLRKLLPPFLILIFISFLGVVAFLVVEGVSLLDAIYMVVVTLSTDGISAAYKLSSAGKIVVIALIFCGLLTVFYLAGQFVEIIMEGQIIGYRRRKQMENRIKELKDHYIICGFGRVGHQVAVELEAAKIPYVVLDSKPETAEELGAKNIPYIVGDISSDKILIDAGIKNAKGLISSADSDTANVFVTLSARVLNPDLTIIARASSIDAEEKMKKAGANRVISPYFIAGKRMAAVATKPVAIDFLDTVLHSEHLEMEVREFKLTSDCTLAGKSLGAADIRGKTGAFIMAIRKASGEFNFQPGADTIIEVGDILVAIGTPNQLDSLQKGLHW